MSYLVKLIVCETVKLSIQDLVTLEYVLDTAGKEVKHVEVKKDAPLEFIVEPDGSGKARILITTEGASDKEKDSYKETIVKSGELCFPPKKPIKQLSTLMKELEDYPTLKDLADRIVTIGVKTDP